MTEDVGTILIVLLSSFYWILLKTKLKWIVKLDVMMYISCTTRFIQEKTTKSNQICCKVCSSFEASFFVESFCKQKMLTIYDFYLLFERFPNCGKKPVDFQLLYV